MQKLVFKINDDDDDRVGEVDDDVYKMYKYQIALFMYKQLNRIGSYL